MLRLLARGRTNAQIGAELYMSPKTASVHVSSIFRKLGVSGRAQAAAVAERAGLLDTVSPKANAGQTGRAGRAQARARPASPGQPTAGSHANDLKFRRFQKGVRSSLVLTSGPNYERASRLTPSGSAVGRAGIRWRPGENQA